MRSVFTLMGFRVVFGGERGFEVECVMLTRPWINAFDTASMKAPWLSESGMKVSPMDFIVVHVFSIANCCLRSPSYSTRSQDCSTSKHSL